MAKQKGIGQITIVSVKDGVGIESVTEYYALTDGATVSVRKIDRTLTSGRTYTYTNEYYNNGFVHFKLKRSAVIRAITVNGKRYDFVSMTDGLTASQMLDGQTSVNPVSFEGVLCYALTDTVLSNGVKASFDGVFYCQSNLFMQRRGNGLYNGNSGDRMFAIKTGSYGTFSIETNDVQRVELLYGFPYIVDETPTKSNTTFTTTPKSPTSTMRYLWNYEVITFTDGTTQETTPRVVGQYGDTGVGISSVNEYYLASSEESGVTWSTEGWTTKVQSASDEKRYLWNYETITKTDGTKMMIAPRIIGTYGEKGDTGAHMSKVTEMYAVSSNNSTTPTAWFTRLQTMTEKTPYLWNYEIIELSNGEKKVTTPRVIGVFGRNGVGIQAITEHYALSALYSQTGVAVTKGTAVPTEAVYRVDASNEMVFSFVRSKHIYSISITENGATRDYLFKEYTRSLTANVELQRDSGTASRGNINYEELKDSGSFAFGGDFYVQSNATLFLQRNGGGLYNGSSGNRMLQILGLAKGVEVSIVCEEGALILDCTATRVVSPSKEEMKWSDTPLMPTTEQPYLWNYETVEYTDGATEETDMRLIGSLGRQGAKGEKGNAEYVWFAYADDTNGTGMSEEPGSKMYIGVYKGTSATRPTSPKLYSWSKYKGDDAVMYALECSPTVLHCKADGTVLTDNISVGLIKTVGAESSVCTNVPEGYEINIHNKAGAVIYSFGSTDNLPEDVTVLSPTDESAQPAYAVLLNASGDVVSRDDFTKVYDGDAGNSITAVDNYYALWCDTTFRYTSMKIEAPAEDRGIYETDAFTVGENGELTASMNKNGFLKIRTNVKSGTLRINIKEGYRVVGLVMTGYSNNTSTTADRSITVSGVYFDDNFQLGGVKLPGGTAGQSPKTIQIDNSQANKYKATSKVLLSFDNSLIDSSDSAGKNQQILANIKLLVQKKVSNGYYSVAESGASGDNYISIPITIDNIRFSDTTKVPTESAPYLFAYEKYAFSDKTSSVTTPHIVRQYLRPGNDAVVYRLLPSMSAIVFSRAANGNLSPTSYSLTCGYSKTVGGETETHEGGTTAACENIDGKYYIIVREARSDGTTGNWNWLKDYTNQSINVWAPGTVSAIEFALTDGSMKTHYDVVTVPIIRDGDNGNGISGAVVEYVVSGQGATPPTEGWSTTLPSVGKGKYLWSRTTTAYTSGKSVVTYAVSYVGMDDQIASTETKYVWGAGYTSQPADSAPWADKLGSIALGDFVWSRTKIVYNSGAQTVTYSASRVGADGTTVQGASAFVHFAYADSITLNGGGKYQTGTGLSLTRKNSSKWLGVLSDTTQQDSTTWSDYEWVKIVGADGSDASFYSLRATTQNVRLDADGKARAGSVTFRLFYVKGNTTKEVTGAVLYLPCYVNGSQINYVRDDVDGDGLFSWPCTYSWSAGGDYPRTARLDEIPRVDDEDGEDKTLMEMAFTVTRDGADGDDAVVYQLEVSPTTLHYDGNGKLTTKQISVSIFKTTGARVEEMALLPDNLWLDFVNKSGNTIESYNSPGGVSLPVVYDLSSGVPDYVYLNDENSTSMARVDFTLVSDGAEGKRGLQGCLYRTAEYADGMCVRNDTGKETSRLAGGVGYVDVVVIADAAVVTGYMAYVFKGVQSGDTAETDGSLRIVTGKTDPDTEFKGLTGTESKHWVRVNASAPILTPLIMAKNAVLKFMQGNQLVIQDESGKVYAGMQGGDIPFWVGAGATDPTTAPSYIDKNGNAYFRNARLGGYLFSQFRNISDSDALTVFDRPEGCYIGGTAYLLQGDLNVYASSNQQIVLPIGSEYEGARVIINNNNSVNVNGLASYTITVGTLDGSPILGADLIGKDDSNVRSYGADVIDFNTGTLEFLCMARDMTGYNVDSGYEYIWVLVNSNCMCLSWERYSKTFARFKEFGVLQ